MNVRTQGRNLSSALSVTKGELGKDYFMYSKIVVGLLDCICPINLIVLVK